ncbi:RICIN domain-containing protein [Kitasatospora sp. NPDC058406]|uniref:RICIN domain-containing protein n=1 Tax=Kitasatospora sp. NPDC058406 TaxID=3346483 RepID=UPI0036529A72
MKQDGPPRPDDAANPAELVTAMRRLRLWADLSYRQLERRASLAGDVLPRATLAAALARPELPRAELLAAYVRACGGGSEAVDEWLRARRRIAVSAEDPNPGSRTDGPVPVPVAVPASVAASESAPVAPSGFSDTPSAARSEHDPDDATSSALHPRSCPTPLADEPGAGTQDGADFTTRPPAPGSAAIQIDHPVVTPAAAPVAVPVVTPAVPTSPEKTAGGTTARAVRPTGSGPEAPPGVEASSLPPSRPGPSRSPGPGSTSPLASTRRRRRRGPAVAGAALAVAAALALIAVLSRPDGRTTEAGPTTPTPTSAGPSAQGTTAPAPAPAPATDTPTAPTGSPAPSTPPLGSPTASRAPGPGGVPATDTSATPGTGGSQAGRPTAAAKPPPATVAPSAPATVAPSPPATGAPSTSAPPAALPAAGWARIQPAGTGLCLTEGRERNGRTNREIAVQASCEANLLPRVYLESVGADVYRIQWRHPEHGTGCLGVDGGYTGPQALLSPGDCSSAGHQRFRLEPATGGYRLKPMHSGLCIGLQDPVAPGAEAIQENCTSASDQVFQITAG